MQYPTLYQLYELSQQNSGDYLLFMGEISDRRDSLFVFFGVLFDFMLFNSRILLLQFLRLSVCYVTIFCHVR